MPVMVRPPLNWSRLARLLASCNGLRNTVSSTELPIFNREVTAAT